MLATFRGRTPVTMPVSWEEGCRLDNVDGREGQDQYKHPSQWYNKDPMGNRKPRNK